MSTISRTVRIAASHGLHARPAKLFAQAAKDSGVEVTIAKGCLLYTSPSPRDRTRSRMPSSA